LRGKLALITGATSGIGAACAEVLAAKGCNLILTGRREDRLRESAAKLKAAHKIEVTTLAFDVSSRAETEQALASDKALLKNLAILVNNAGLAAGSDKLTEADLDDVDTMIDTNLKGVLYMTRLCLPYMVERGDGHIVNLGSVAGRWTYSGGAVYCATKFAVRAITDALRMDLKGSPIRVTNIEPGMVETEFSVVRFGGNEDKAKAIYKNMQPLTGKDIAETILWCLERPVHVNIQELVIFPTDQSGVGNHAVHRRE
jgi:NADP-dependent 3-hydroxy acid dehydrogenase YdfG